MAQQTRTNDNISVVIFGASGDLTHRKLVPSLYNLYRKGRLPRGARIVGFARSDLSDDAFRRGLREGMEELAGITPEERTWTAFAQRIFYCRGDLTSMEDHQKLARFLLEKEQTAADRLYYMAVMPELYTKAVGHLGATGLAAETEGWRRVVVEKPFGHDLSSCRALNRTLHETFREGQIYRIDHYLGKETAQNIHFLRFANTIFEPVWNRNYVDNVQITVAETVDVAHRAPYYEKAGVLRDMFQNHLLQLLSLITMEPPASFRADAVRNEKVKVFTAIRPLDVADTVCAQYQDYRGAQGVAPDSVTPTYAAVKLFIDNWRWQGVPFYLRSGKALAAKGSEIVVEFHRPPHVMFNLPEGHELTPNILSLCIQPHESILLRFETKVPDSYQETRSVTMEFHYHTSFGEGGSPDAYERLLLDALNGDPSLFTRHDAIERAWELMDPVIAAWEGPEASRLAFYERGSWGPEEAEELIRRDGRQWRLGCAGTLCE